MNEVLKYKVFAYYCKREDHREKITRLFETFYVWKWSFDGTFTSKHFSNNKHYECNYRNGKLHGKYTEWDHEGNIKRILYYEDDQLVR